MEGSRSSKPRVGTEGAEDPNEPSMQRGSRIEKGRSESPGRVSEVLDCF